MEQERPSKEQELGHGAEVYQQLGRSSSEESAPAAQVEAENPGLISRVREKLKGGIQSVRERVSHALVTGEKGEAEGGEERLFHNLADRLRVARNRARVGLTGAGVFAGGVAAEVALTEVQGPMWLQVGARLIPMIGASAGVAGSMGAHEARTEARDMALEASSTSETGHEALAAEEQQLVGRIHHTLEAAKKLSSAAFQKSASQRPSQS